MSNITNNTYIQNAVAELELHLQKEQEFIHNKCLTETEHFDIFNVIQKPKVFPRVEYSPCVLVVDNR